MKVRLNPLNFNDLPLWGAAREAELQRLPPPARRLALRYGLDGATARLVTSLAGIANDGRHE